MTRRTLLAAVLTLITTAASAQAITPNPAFTPGAVRTTDVTDICTTSTRQYRHRHDTLAILAEYGLPLDDRWKYTIDHLIPLELGGADNLANLWPEPTIAIEPEWNDARKDELEHQLHTLVCTGNLSLATAQRIIVDDWPEAYRLYVGPYLGK